MSSPAASGGEGAAESGAGRGGVRRRGTWRSGGPAARGVESEQTAGGEVWVETPGGALRWGGGKPNREGSTRAGRDDKCELGLGGDSGEFWGKLNGEFFSASTSPDRNSAEWPEKN